MDMIPNNIRQSFKNKNVLVTGGTGLIGRQVTDILTKYKANVDIVSLDKIKVNEHANHIYGDLTDYNFCKEITKEKDFVFHIAGIKGNVDVTLKQPSSFFVPLLQMNTNVLEASRINNVKKVVYTSSIGAYPQSDKQLLSESDDDLLSNPMGLNHTLRARVKIDVLQAERIKIDTDYNDEIVSYGEDGWKIAKKIFEYTCRAAVHIKTGKSQSLFRETKFIHCFLNQCGYDSLKESAFHSMVAWQMMIKHLREQYKKTQESKKCENDK